MVALKPVPTISKPGTAAAMIAMATSQIGVHEGQDERGWNNDNPYGEWYGFNRVAWCAIFISWSAAKSGCGKIVPRGAYTPSVANWYQAKNRWHRNPKVGDQFFKYGFVPSENRSRIHHTGLVIKVLDNGFFLTVEGNTNNSGSSQGDGVYKLKRSIQSLGSEGGFGRPAYKPVFTKTQSIVIAISLKSTIRYARKHNNYGPGTVGTALKKESGGNTIRDYAEYQRSLGYKGSDADGIAGKESLTALGKKYGFRVID